MATSWRDSKTRLTAKERAEVARLKRDGSVERTLQLGTLATARRKTQDEIAETLNIRQPAVSRLESRTDLYISTLRRFVEAMGGKLVITAEFPDGERLRIEGFQSIGETESSR